MALQTLVDTTKISIASNSTMELPKYHFILFPKPAYTASEFEFFEIYLNILYKIFFKTNFFKTNFTKKKKLLQIG